MAGVAASTISGAEAGSSFGPWGTVIGGAVGLVGGLLSSNKKAPATVPYNPVDLQGEQNKAIGGNLSALPTVDELLARSNTFQQSQASQLMEQSLPGYGEFARKLTATATNLAENPYQVPKSVVDQLTQYAAENNIAGGTGAASGFSESNILRSLGVNALQYGQSNLSSAMSALSVLTGTAPRTSPMSPMSFLVTPGQQIDNQKTTNQLQQQSGQGGANASAAASNWDNQNLWDSITGTITPSYVNSVAGVIAGGKPTGTPTSGGAPSATSPSGGVLVL